MRARFQQLPLNMFSNEFLTLLLVFSGFWKSTIKDKSHQMWYVTKHTYHICMFCVCARGWGGQSNWHAMTDKSSWGFGVLLKNTWAFLADKASYFIVRAQVVTTGPRAMHNQQILICWKALKGFSEQHTRLNHLQKMKHPLGSIWQRVQPHWGRAESTFSLPSVFLSLCISAYLLFSLLQSRQGEEQRRKRWGCQVMCCQGV